MKKLFIGLLCLAMLGMLGCALNEPALQYDELLPQDDEPTLVLIYDRPFHAVTPITIHPSIPEFALTQYGYLVFYYPPDPERNIIGYVRVHTMVITNEAGFYQRLENLTAAVGIYDEIWLFSCQTEFRDLNGDGYRDIKLPNRETRPRTADFLLWCSDAGKFVFNETLRELYPFSVEWDTDLLNTSTFSTDDLGYRTHYSRSYLYRDGALELQRKRRVHSPPERTEPDSRAERIAEYFERMGNDMVLVRRDTQDSRWNSWDENWDREIQELVNGELITVHRTRTSAVVEDGELWDVVERLELVGAELALVWRRRTARGDEQTLRDYFHFDIDSGELMSMRRYYQYTNTDENVALHRVNHSYMRINGELVLMFTHHEFFYTDGPIRHRRYERINGEMQLIRE